MRLFVDNDQHAAELLAHLSEQVSFVVARTAELEISVSVLGSYADGGAAALAAHLARWRTHHPDVDVRLETSLTPTRELEERARELVDRVLRAVDDAA